MLIQLKALTNCRDEVQRFRKQLSKLSEIDSITGDLRQTLRSNAERWEGVFYQHGFDKAFNTAQRLVQQLHKSAPSNGEVMVRLRDLNEDFADDAFDIWVYTVPHRYLQYHDVGLGDTVDKAFPEASKELREAGNCIAFGCFTAGVFHLMRAAEHAMRAIAIASGASTTPPSKPLEYQQWEPVIVGIESRMETESNKWPDPSRANARAFFRPTVADLLAFKDETRNVCFHSRNKPYDFPGAASQWNRVDVFFSRLMGKVDEAGTRNLLDASRFL
jgi:hypothetical protein